VENDDRRLRLNTRLPPILWAALRRLAGADGLTHDQEVRKLIADAGGVQEAPGSTGRLAEGVGVDEGHGRLRGGD
jgi:hypothetical protein